MMRFLRDGRVAVFLLPVVVAGVLGLLSPAHTTSPPPESERGNMHTVNVQATAELEQLFNDLDYHWPPAAETPHVPAVSVETLPGDFDEIEVQQRKALFFRILAPLVVAGNRALLEQREFLLHAFAEHESLPEQGDVSARVREIAERFNIEGDLDHAATRERLLKRVDTVPLALALAQAANESGWGTSRFAREANNVFGMWTWDADSGVLPQNRAANARHFVRVFKNLRGAVENYLHTINVGDAYRDLRDLRREQRQRNEYPDGWLLAAGLSRYSERGDEYVKEIRHIIRFNKLHTLPRLDIDETTFLAARH